MMKKTFLVTSLLLNFLLIQNIEAQNVHISGRVIDAQSQKMLPAANVTVLGTSIGTATDSNGKYELDVPQSADSLRFSFVGYKTKTVAINGRTTINVSLQSNVKQLGEEMVVTAFGVKQNKRAIGYSTQSVSGDEISSTQQDNVVSALQGKVAGVQI